MMVGDVVAVADVGPELLRRRAGAERQIAVRADMPLLGKTAARRHEEAVPAQLRRLQLAQAGRPGARGIVVINHGL